MSDPWVDRLSEYLDGELTATDTTELEKHLEGCDECVAILEELRQVVSLADGLGDSAPPSHVWAGVAAEILATPASTNATADANTHMNAGEETDAIVAGTSGTSAPGAAAPTEAEGDVASVTKRTPRTARRGWSASSVSLSMPQVIAACLVLMVVSAAAGWFGRAMGPGGDGAGADGASGAGGDVVAEARMPEDRAYDRVSEDLPGLSLRQLDDPYDVGTEIAALRWEEAVAEQERVYMTVRARLDTTTVRVLEKNLTILDKSIEEIQEKKDSDPGNSIWDNRLAEGLRRKLKLLQLASSISTREI